MPSDLPEIFINTQVTARLKAAIEAIAAAGGMSADAWVACLLATAVGEAQASADAREAFDEEQLKQADAAGEDWMRSLLDGSFGRKI